MKVEYLVWEKDGQPVSWAVGEGDAQTIGDFLSEQADRKESCDEFKERLAAELDLVFWREDCAQPLPFGWRCARSDEVARISVALSQRLAAKNAYRAAAG